MAGLRISKEGSGISRNNRFTASCLANVLGHGTGVDRIDVDAVAVGIDREVFGVRFSTPVARMPKWPAARIAMSRSVALWQRFSASALSAAPGAFDRRQVGLRGHAAAPSAAADQAWSDDGERAYR
jgi:hypothetical protein